MERMIEDQEKNEKDKIRIIGRKRSCEKWDIIFRNRNCWSSIDVWCVIICDEIVQEMRFKLNFPKILFRPCIVKHH